MLTPALLLCLLAATCCAAPPARPRSHNRGRIVGGEPVDISQFPWQIAHEYDGELYCGGSIISNTWVLTEAACIDSATPYDFVRAGTSTRHSGGTVYQVEAVIVHEGFHWVKGDYDVAVLSIMGSFTFGNNVQAVSLATTEPAVGTSLTISGWGDLATGEDLPGQLHAVSTVIMDRDTCDTYWPGITENMLCAGGNDKGACYGDGGGALVIGSTQYGIFSRTTCSLDGYPDVYTNVAAVRSWITNNTGI